MQGEQLLDVKAQLAEQESEVLRLKAAMVVGAPAEPLQPQDIVPVSFAPTFTWVTPRQPLSQDGAVSYTHLTLPTKRIV